MLLKGGKKEREIGDHMVPWHKAFQRREMELVWFLLRLNIHEVVFIVFN